MIASTLQLSLNRAKVSFLLCGSNEKFINLCRIVGAVSYYNYENCVTRDSIFPLIVCSIFYSNPSTNVKPTKTSDRVPIFVKRSTGKIPQIHSKPACSKKRKLV